jgi:hypothetical protein
MNLFHSEWLPGASGGSGPARRGTRLGNRAASAAWFGPPATGRRSAPLQDPRWRAAQSSAITRSANSEHFTSVALSISRAKS